MRIGWIAVAVALAYSPAVLADDWKDESGKGREWKSEHRNEYKHEFKREGRAWKEEYDDGHCKVERKRERSGEYKEEVKCKGPHWQRGYYVPSPSAGRIVIELPTALPPLPSGPNYAQAFRDAQGRYCREYQTAGVVNGKRRPLYGTACLQPDGAWAFND